MISLVDFVKKLPITGSDPIGEHIEALEAQRVMRGLLTGKEVAQVTQPLDMTDEEFIEWISELQQGKLPAKEK